MWTTRTLILSPSHVNTLVRQRRAVLGPGPRGLTITTREVQHPLAPLAFEYGERQDVTRTYQLTEVLWFEGVPSLRYVYRRWA